MPQHRLALCKTHYPEWFLQQTEKTIHKYRMLDRQDHILAAVSGGKDSLALWDALWKLGYPVDGMYIDLGIVGDAVYSHSSREKAQSFAASRGLNLHIVDLQQTYGKSIPDLVTASTQGFRRPCSVCGTVKRRIFNTLPREKGYSVIATGHNLDDEVAVLFTNNLSWDLDQLQRQAPVLEARGNLVRKVKPFCRFGERETTAYALINRIEYIEEECPFSSGSHTNQLKLLWNQMEKEKPGSKLFYYTRFLQAKATGKLISPTDESENLTECPQCGELTGADGLCSFCRIMAKSSRLRDIVWE
jgi:tRNA-5-methyluridine54 2-sulfurtransferase